MMKKLKVVLLRIVPVGNLGMICTYRQNEVHANTYCIPEKYRLITDKEIKELFVRSDRRN